MVDAAAGERADLARRGVAQLASIDRMRGAAAQRLLELLGAAVDRDNRGGARDPGGRDHLQADAAAADDADALADRDRGRVADGAKAGDDAAAE